MRQKDVEKEWYEKDAFGRTKNASRSQNLLQKQVDEQFKETIMWVNMDQFSKNLLDPFINKR